MTLSKKILLLGMLSIFVFSACRKDDCIKHRMEYTWSNNKSIAIDPEVETVMMGDSMISLIEYQVIDGSHILFEFNEFFNICDPDIADGSGSKKFSMVIPSDSTNSFSYTDEEILATSAFYDIFAAPSGYSHQWIEEGEIIGKKIDDNSWRVSIDVVTKIQEYGAISGEEPEVISIDAVFLLE